MKVGSIAFAHSRGLGHLAHDFFTHGVINDVMVVRHSSIPVNAEWYPNAPESPQRPFNSDLARAFCKNHDAMIFFETPFDWSLFPWCQKHGIRTYLVTMYECTPIHHEKPFKYLCPSRLDVDYFKEHNHVFIQLPVEMPWRLRQQALHFVHNGGYLGIRHREGILTLIDAMSYVRAPLRLTIRVQENVPPEYQRKCAADPRIEYLPETIPFEELYATGDVAVGAQKWNGCSLPLQEAFASGLCVCNTDRFPMNTWLPVGPLVKPERYIEDSSIGGPYMKFREAVVNPQALAAKMDELYGMDISEYSLAGRRWAELNSWEKLKPVWMEALSS